MADRIVFLTGSPDLLYVPPQMVEDLLVIAQLSREVIEQLATTLDDSVGFLTEEELRQLAWDAIQDERGVSAFLGAFWSIRPGQIDEVIKTLRDWREADSKNMQRLPDAIFTVLQENLSRLIRNYPAWERFRKARRLASITGNKARRVELICDARPVFDQDRQQIEGFIPLTTLKLMYESQTEESGSVEVVLSVDVLEELLEKSKKAQEKVTLLRDFLSKLIPDGVIGSID